MVDDVDVIVVESVLVLIVVDVVEARVVTLEVLVDVSVLVVVVVDATSVVVAEIVVMVVVSVVVVEVNVVVWIDKVEGVRTVLVE